MAWPGFGNIRFDSIMGRQKPYIDESGAIGGKRFTTGSVPTWEEQYRPHQSQGGPNPWEQKERPDEAGSYYDELERIRNNRGPALTAYQKALGEQPTWEQHKPDWKRRLAGALISASSAAGGDDTGRAVALGQSVVRSPYDTARSEYANKMKNLGASAKLEQDEMEAQLQSLKEARALGLKYDEYRLKQLENEQKRRHDEGTLDVARGNLAVNQGKLGVDQFTADTGRASQVQTGRHYDNQDVNAAHTGSVNERNVNSQITDRVERQKIAREGIIASLERARIQAGRRAPANPREQQDAIDGALRDLKTDPEMAQYMETDAQGFLNPKADDMTPGYQRFRARLVEAAHRRLLTGLPYGAPPPEEDIPVRRGGGGAEW